MKRLYILIIPFILLYSSCTKDITDLNEETKRAATIPPGPLFTNAIKNLSDGLASASVNVNIFRHIVKYWGQAVIQQEAQYDYITRAVNENWWSRMYKDVLNDLQEAARIINEDESLSPGQKANQLAMVDIMQVYTYDILIKTFGDIPYTEALDDNNLFPVYDDAQTVYYDLLRRLDEDIANLNTSSPGFSSSEDILYQGNVSNWVAFSNSLKLRMAMTLADVDSETAKAAFEEANANAITSEDQNAFIEYYNSPPNNNPLYDQLVLAGRTDYIAAQDLLEELVELEDPRLPGYFGLNDEGEYSGGVVGRATSFSQSSKPSDRVAAPDAPNVLIDLVEVEFLRAEAVERGYDIPGSAEEHYNNGVTASILYWGGTAEEAQEYLNQPEVAYSSATGDWKQKIGFQKWIALYNRPFEAWVEMRRLDHPDLPLAENAISGFPNRLRYPGNEQQLNNANYSQASANIGGDETETKLFWDVF
ncbi:SusD-like starch-binding protein associating with outer membrane [Gillisia sp. Hel_I_86]|uniref:SusD/RagB family nutrient-binding outer membrane lipoprotein n=1 Tax=Gillisia sp. Hel_I_86 TaxID=1249981 RepID=UPI001199CEB2|nr:SusD/RagB family nutrient-binding outer membrane lipoprotein [Gillisia sp. Hel_I_86]TVZ26026.1 SusD-like starch-binding protein associating with outer membrane [Gillisia sp. Hel_I_86]